MSVEATKCEVLAELPCQREEWGEVAEKCTSQEVRDREAPPISLCVSCEARREREARYVLNSSGVGERAFDNAKRLADEAEVTA